MWLQFKTVSILSLLTDIVLKGMMGLIAIMVIFVTIISFFGAVLFLFSLLAGWGAN